MKFFELFGPPVSPWVYVPIFLLIWTGTGWVLKAALFGRLRKLAQKTESRLDDLLIDSLNAPLNLLILVSAAMAVVHWTPAGDMLRQRGEFRTAMLIVTVLAGILFVDRLLRGTIALYAERLDLLRSAGGLLQGLVRGLVIGIGLLILLDSLGISIAPILASLGVGSLAVALALQPTLENFFAGVQIVIDRPIQPGHFIRLESGEEGYVDKIGWRSTQVRLLPNNMIIIPNKQLVGSRVLNYHYPTPDLAVLVQVGVHYNSNLEAVERVTVEVAEEIQGRVPGAVRDFKPFIRYHTFNSSSIDFTVILRAEEFVANYLIKHEFIKALQARYAKEGIVIPFPIMALNVQQENAAAGLDAVVSAGTGPRAPFPAPPVRQPS